MRGGARASATALLLCAALSGCKFDEGPLGLLRPSKPRAKQIHSNYAVGGFGNIFGNSIAPDRLPGVYVESVLLERPVGDPLLDRGLWSVDSSGISARKQTLLGENGLRVAVFGGNLPGAFQKLIGSNENMVDPHETTFANRAEAVLPTVGPLEQCEFFVLADLSGRKESLKLAQATGGFLIQPERTEDGRVKLRCEPQVQYGQRQEWIRPTADATGFTYQGEAPLKRYPSLAFEVSLSPGEYLVIGSPSNAKQSLGAALFNVDTQIEARQRVLVLRAGFRGEAPSDLPEVSRPHGFRPIALEAYQWSRE